MPEIKIKHIVSFSSEDKIHKAQNLLKPETYYKWKCASAGEKKATVTLQLEKASTIHSIDIGNEHSAFVEVLVSRSSDEKNDFQVLLVTSSFMSPLESRNGTNTNRVRMFDGDKLAKNVKDEKWDLVQIICTQPFNKNIQYGLSFIKFHSPPDPSEDSKKQSDSQQSELKIGKFKLKSDDEWNPMSVGAYFMKKKVKPDNNIPATSPSAIKQSFASATLANLEKTSPVGGVSTQKRRLSDSEASSASTPPAKKPSPVTHVNKEKIGYKNIFGGDSDDEDKSSQVRLSHPRSEKQPLAPPAVKPPAQKNAPSSSTEQQIEKRTVKGKEAPKIKRKPFNRIMEKVVFVLSGFQNPYRSELRDAALEMGAKYKADWDSTCTHLVCAFVNTPKYLQVRGKGGRIVKKEWIFDCHKKKELLPWRKYMLGKYTKDSSTEEEDGADDDHEVVRKNESNHQRGDKKAPAKSKQKSPVKPSPHSSDTEHSGPKRSLFTLSNTTDKQISDSDTDAEDDYGANTDVDGDSGGDTEDEIAKFQLAIEKSSPEKKLSSRADRGSNFEDRKVLNGSIINEHDSSEYEKPDTKDIPLMDLPDFFKGRHFFLYGDFSGKEIHDLERYITAYNGHVNDYMGPDVKYVITKAKWSKDFDDALDKNENLIFVRPAWVLKCHQNRKCVPFQPFIVVPDT